MIKEALSNFFREFFGPDAILYGVDIEPTCAHFATPPNEIRIGSQDDQSFLRAVVNEMGGVDVVLDDGSHVGRHQQASFETLFPILPDDGLYIIEDTHTSYWTYWEGGYRKSGTAIEYCKALVDDMHHWYHNRPLSTPLAKEIGGLFFHDSLIVIEKAQARRPMKAKMGTSTKRE